MSGSKLRNLRFDGAGTLTYVRDRVRVTRRSGEAFAEKEDLAKILLADSSVVDLEEVEAAEATAEAEAAATAGEGTGYEAMNVKQLRELATKRGLGLPSRANKDAMVAAHVAADAADATDAATDDTADAAEQPAPPASGPVVVEANSGGPVTLGDLPASAKVKN